MSEEFHHVSFTHTGKFSFIFITKFSVLNIC